MRSRSILIIVGLIGLLLIGTGALSLFRLQAPRVSTTVQTVSQPDPILVMDEYQMLQMAVPLRHYLEIYSSGEIKYYADSIPDKSELKVIKTWYSGTIDKTGMQNLAAYLKDKSSTLADSYSFPQIAEQDKPIAQVDQKITITVNFGGVIKRVYAEGWWLAYSSYIGPHHDLPGPLNEIYSVLNDIARQTTQIAREDVPASTQ